MRDPAARAFSGYLFLNRPLLFAPSSDPASYWRARALRFSHGDKAPLSANLSFTDYLRWLCETRPRNIDGHFAPQYTDIEAALGERLAVYRIEAIDEAFREIETRFRLSESPPEKQREIHASKHHMRKSPQADTLRRIIDDGHARLGDGKNRHSALHYRNHACNP